MDKLLPVDEIAFGAALLVISLMVHGVGMYVTRLNAGAYLRRERGFGREMIFGMLILLMIATHLFEVMLWACALDYLDAIADLRDAFWYAAVTYTTLGYGEGMLTRTWRILAPMMAMSGVFAFGWTTGVLWNLVSAPVSHDPHDASRGNNAA